MDDMIQTHKTHSECTQSFQVAIMVLNVSFLSKSFGLPYCWVHSHQKTTADLFQVSHSIQFACIKIRFHIRPCSHLYTRWFDFKFQNGMLGLHSYGKSPVTSSNKSCSAFRMVVQATTLCSLCFLLGSLSISKSSIESHSGSASLSWQKQTKQCFVLRRQALFYILVDCCISQLDIKKHFKSWLNQSICELANHETRSCALFQHWSSLQADCWLQRSKSFPSFDCLIQKFHNIPSLLRRLQNILWGSKGWWLRLCQAAICK